MYATDNARKKPVKNLRSIALHNVRTFVHEQALLSSRFAVGYQPYITK